MRVDARRHVPVVVVARPQIDQRLLDPALLAARRKRVPKIVEMMSGAEPLEVRRESVVIDLKLRLGERQERLKPRRDRDLAVFLPLALLRLAAGDDDKPSSTLRLCSSFRRIPV